MQVTRSQKAIAETILQGLQDREIVCLWGNTPNGKTHVYYKVMGDLSIGLDGRIRSEIKPKHEEDYTVEILEGIELPMIAEKITLDRVKRLILEAYGERPWTRALDMHRRFTRLMIDLDKARIIPTLTMDEVEVLPRKGYSIYKMMNELRHGGKRIGCAILLSGNFSKRKMPENFWMHVKEIQVGKVTPEQVEEFVSYIAPGYHQKFTLSAFKKIAECTSTLEMSRIVRNSLDYWRRHSKDEVIDTPILKAVTDQLTYSKHRIAA